MIENHILEEIKEYGANVLNSDVFKKSFEQTHHVYTSLGWHIIDVAVVSLRLCDKFNITNPEIRRNITVASLCHDLGMVGRYEKYANNLICAHRHPGDGVEVFRSIYTEKNRRVENAIKRHMFPIGLIMPIHIEGFILILSDKICACMEVRKKSPIELAYFDAIYDIVMAEA